GERPGVAGGGPLPAGCGSALHDDDRDALGDGPEALGEGAALADALDVGEGDGRLGVLGEELEVVRDRERGGAARGDGPADTHAGGLGVALERADAVAGLA